MMRQSHFDDTPDNKSYNIEYGKTDNRKNEWLLFIEGTSWRNDSVSF